MATTTFDQSSAHASSQIGIFASITNWLQYNRAVRQTAKELNKLNDRELNDLGISRWDIARIAHEAASGRGR